MGEKKDNNEIVKVKDLSINDTDNEKQLWWNNKGYQVAKGFRENFSNVKSEYKKVEKSDDTSSGGLFRRPAQMSGSLVFRSEEEYKKFISQSGKRIVSSLRFLTFIKNMELGVKVDHFTLKNMTLMRTDRIRDGIIGKIKVNVVFEEYEVIKQETLGDDRTSPGVPPKMRTTVSKPSGTLDEAFEKMGLKKNNKGEWYDPITGKIYG